MQKQYDKGALQSQDSGFTVRDIPIESLVVLDSHPRKCPGKINELSASIHRDGVQTPLMTYRINETTIGIIDGSRRFLVGKESEMETMPCIVKENLTDAEAAHLSYIMNFERNSLSKIEIAKHIKKMRDDFGYSLQELEVKGYGSTAQTSNLLRLLEISESVQDDIQKGILTSAHGLQLSRLATIKEQDRMAKHAKDFDLSAKRLGIRVERYLSKGKKIKTSRKLHVSPSEVPGVYFKDSRNMSELPDKSVHMTLGSISYGIGMEFEKDIPHKVLMQENLEGLDEISRVTVSGGIIAINVKDINNFKGDTGKAKLSYLKLMAPIYQNRLSKHKIYLTDQIIWKKRIPWRKKLAYSYQENTTHASYRIVDNYELVLIFRKAGKREVPPADIALQSRLTREQYIEWVSGVWEIEPVRDMSEHPCIYPDELCYRLITMYSYIGDTILDPWLGSGTTIKVARDLDRVGIGYERDLRYKSLIMKKLGVEQAQGDNEPGIMAKFASNALTEADDIEGEPRQTSAEDAGAEIRELEADGQAADKANDPTAA